MTDADFTAGRDTFLPCCRETFAAGDGAGNLLGSQKLCAAGVVGNLRWSDSLEEAIPAGVTGRPTFSVNPPSSIVVS